MREIGMVSVLETCPVERNFGAYVCATMWGGSAEGEGDWRLGYESEADSDEDGDDFEDVDGMKDATVAVENAGSEDDEEDTTKPKAKAKSKAKQNKIYDPAAHDLAALQRQIRRDAKRAEVAAENQVQKDTVDLLRRGYGYRANLHGKVTGGVFTTHKSDQADMDMQLDDRCLEAKVGPVTLGEGVPWLLPDLLLPIE